MNNWVMIAVILCASSSFAYNFKADTQCVLCSTVIRCGPGIDAIIRPKNSGEEITVEKYCLQQSNESDPKYRELRNVFSKSRFTYSEYLEKIPELKEKRIEVSPKPLIGAEDVINTGRKSDQRNFTDYILAVTDPLKDKDLEVTTDGKLVSKLDKQSKAVRADMKSRKPGSVDSALKRNGAWVSPQQEPYVDPMVKSQTTTRLSAASSTPPPKSFLFNDSFRRGYCRDLTEKECNDIWNNKNRIEALKVESKPIIVPDKKTLEIKPKETNTYNPNPKLSVFSSAAPVETQPSRLPNSVASPTTATNSTAAPTRISPTTNKAITKDSSIKQVATSSTTKLKSVGNTYQTPRQQAIARMATVNTSPAYSKIDVVSPYGTLINIKVQPSGSILEAGRPICDSLKDWRTTTFYVDALRTIDPKNKSISEGNLGSKASYCIGNQDYANISCEFGSAQAACSCNDYGKQYLLARCQEKFKLTKESAESLMIRTCHEKLKTILSEPNVIEQFARPYALSLAETYLCLDASAENRKACNAQTNKTFAAMSEKECTGLYNTLKSKDKSFIDKNKKEFETYPWYNLYSYHSKEYANLFGEYDLHLTPKSLGHGPCNKNIRGVLEQMASQLKADHIKATEKLTSSQSEFKKLFSDDVAKSFESKNKDKEINAQLAKEMSDLSSLYRDLTLFVNLDGGFCTASSPSLIAPKTSPSIFPDLDPPKGLMSPLPGTGSK